MKAFWTVGVVIVVALILCGINYKIGGVDLIKSGLASGVKLFGGMIALIVALSFLSGQISAYYKEKPDTIKKIVDGKHGVLKSILAGVIMPGGLAAGPVLKTEWDNGGSKLAIIAFLVSSGLLNWSGVFFRIPLLGGEITSIMYGIGIVVVMSLASIYFVARFVH